MNVSNSASVDDAVAEPRASGKSRGPYAKTSITRRAILEAAVEVFADRGYHGSSLREIADRVGLTQPALLHHFGSKVGLLEAVLVYRDQTALTYAPLDRGEAEASIRGLIELARFNASQPGVVELYSTLAAEATSPTHPVHAYFTGRYARVRDTLTTAYQQLKNQGQLQDGVDPARAAKVTMAVMDGLQTQWLLAPDVIDMPAELTHLLRRVTRLTF